MINSSFRGSDRLQVATVLRSAEITELFAPSGGLTFNLGKITGTIIDNDDPPLKQLPLPSTSATLLPPSTKPPAPPLASKSLMSPLPIMVRAQTF